MSVATERAALVSDLEQVFPRLSVHSQVPDRLNPPAVIVAEGDPWLYEIEGETPHGYKMCRFNIHLVGLKVESSNARAIRQIDQLVERLIAHIPVTEVRAPYVLEHSQGRYLAVQATFDNLIDCKEI